MGRLIFLTNSKVPAAAQLHGLTHECMMYIHDDKGVIPCQFNQALPHFVLDFLYMLTIGAKICLGNIFQVIASKV